MKIDRRNFLKFLLFLSLPFSRTFAASDKKERVILLRDKYLFDKKERIDKERLKEMIKKGFCLLEETDNIEDALKKNFNKNEIIGIKSNEWGPLPTPEEVEDILKEFLLLYGIKEENIEINDRGVLRSKIFKNSTSLINVRPMRTHHWAGVGSLIKNYIMFSDSPPSYHPNFCSDLGKLWELPIVKGKTRINILVMFTPLFYGVGAHHFDKRYTWKYCGLIFGKKPASCDALGLKIIKEKRKEYFGKDIQFQPPPIHIGIADKVYNLGTTNLNEIELIKINKYEDDLI